MLVRFAETRSRPLTGSQPTLGQGGRVARYTKPEPPPGQCMEPEEHKHVLQVSWRPGALLSFGMVIALGSFGETNDDSSIPIVSG